MGILDLFLSDIFIDLALGYGVLILIYGYYFVFVERKISSFVRFNLSSNAFLSGMGAYLVNLLALQLLRNLFQINIITLENGLIGFIYIIIIAIQEELLKFSVLLVSLKVTKFKFSKIGLNNVFGIGVIAGLGYQFLEVLVKITIFSNSTLPLGTFLLFFVNNELLAFSSHPLLTGLSLFYYTKILQDKRSPLRSLHNIFLIPMAIHSLTNFLEIFIERIKVPYSEFIFLPFLGFVLYKAILVIETIKLLPKESTGEVHG